MKYFTSAAAIFLWLLLAASATAKDTADVHLTLKPAFGKHYSQQRSRLFLIAVIDSNDKDIGERCKTDLDYLTDDFKDLADWMDMDMEEPRIIQGDDFSKAAVNDALDNWLPSQEPGKDDVIVFYYSGHGFRYPGDAGTYPRMWLKTSADRDVERNNLRMKEDVYDRIVKMGAGMNLVLSDCCNTTVAGDNANFDNVTVPTRKREIHKREHPKSNDGDDDDMDNGDKLFNLDHSLSILATAAGAGELAGGTADAGGFFTYYFLEAMDKCIYDEKLEPSWDAIFKYADDKASYWARSAACPTAKHNEQGRCVQSAEIKMDGSN